MDVADEMLAVRDVLIRRGKASYQLLDDRRRVCLYGAMQVVQKGRVCRRLFSKFCVTESPLRTALMFYIARDYPSDRYSIAPYSDAQTEQVVLDDLYVWAMEEKELGGRERGSMSSTGLVPVA